jgi:predicted RNase H-like nuclease (RuvC/YqgF family)
MNDFEKEEFWKGLARLYDQSMADRERIEALGERIEALRGRIDALTTNVETLTTNVETLRATVEVDANNIRALARIAEIHEHRLNGLEGGTV